MSSVLIYTFIVLFTLCGNVSCGCLACIALGWSLFLIDFFKFYHVFGDFWKIGKSYYRCSWPSFLQCHHFISGKFFQYSFHISACIDQYNLSLEPTFPRFKKKRLEAQCKEYVKVNKFFDKKHELEESCEFCLY